MARTAHSLNYYDISDKLNKCCSDAIVYKSPDGVLHHAPMFCGHRLCPLCARQKTIDLRRRMDTIVGRANSFVTLTCYTDEDDRKLKFYIQNLQSALRLLTHRRNKSDWLPFGDGYMWKMEVTDSRFCFHPHIHVITPQGFIPHAQLQGRWRYALSCHGLSGGIVWIRPPDRAALLEMSKYLAKGLKEVHPFRWQALNDGLRKQRAYGSGGSMTLPPAKDPNAPQNTLVGFASKWEDREDIKQYCIESALWNDLDVQSPVAKEMRKALHFDHITYNYIQRHSGGSHA